MVTALRDERGDHGLLVALCAREQRRLLAAVLVAPLPQADERDMEVAALSGQVVLVPLRPFLIGNPLEDSFVDQPAKTVWNSSNRRSPSRASRTISRVHRSPTISRARAIEQFWPS
jgi:hypothetical protein